MTYVTQTLISSMKFNIKLLRSLLLCYSFLTIIPFIAQGVGPNSVQIPVRLEKGWNLFSLPVSPPNFDKNDFFQGVSAGSLWTFENNSLRPSDTIKAGKAYWIYLHSEFETDFSVRTDTLSTDSLDVLKVGWNLSGPLSPTELPLSAKNAWYYRDGIFHTTNDILTPGVGYWIHSSKDSERISGNLILDSDNDGLPDFWESLWKLNPHDPSDVSFDGDEDGLSARSEYLSGTRPDRVDSDGDNYRDLEELAFGFDASDKLRYPVTSFVISPDNGEQNVTLGRQTIVTFSKPLSAATSVTDDDIHVLCDGKTIPMELLVSPDRRRVSIHYTNDLPANRRVRIVVDGDGLIDEKNHPVDGNHDGTSGGIGHFYFDTIGFDPVAPVFDTFPEITGQMAGYLQGDFRVNERGSANYKIPLTLPPGTNGIAPKLSLSYDSRSGNGPLGMGWSLQGLSMIARCATTQAQDGFIDGVDFDDNDKFCLDGQRLLASKGIYGKDGTEYRTENESFTKVISYGHVASGPASFRTWTKDGLIYEYGMTGDSQIEAQGRADMLSWRVNRIEDRFGNYLTISYNETNATGENYVSQIDYTGNVSANLVPYNSIKFIYEDRPDVFPAYVSGALIQRSKRLSKVEVYHESNLLREYRLSYQQTGGSSYSQLQSVTECDDDGLCMNPTEFSWEVENPTSFDLRHLLPVTNGTNGGIYLNPDHNNVTTGDWNGDGLADVINLHPLTSAGNRTNSWVGLSKGDGSFDFLHTIPRTDGAEGGIYLNTIYKHILAGDFNGDGATDIINLHPQTTSNNRTNSWGGLSNQDGSFTFHHMIPATNGSVGGIYINATYRDILTGDFNGDGRADILNLHPQTTSNNRTNSWVGLSNGDASFNFLHTLPTTNGSAGGIYINIDHKNVLTGDFNGDGLTDIMNLHPLASPGNASNSWVGLSRGDGNFDFLHTIPATDGGSDGGIYINTIYGNVISGDFNGDGLTDIMNLHPETTAGNVKNSWVGLSKGDGSFEFMFTISSTFTTAYINRNYPEVFAADWNGDGLTDLVHYHPQTTAAIKENSWVALSKGDGTFDFHYIIPDTAQTAYVNLAYRSMLPGDFNGDGALDILHLHPFASVASNSWMMVSQMPPNERIVSITNGHGSAVTVDYLPLTNDTIYTKSQGPAYPYRDIQAPMYVVAAYETDNGIGGTSRVSHTYEGLRIQLDGRGFCGFARTIATNEQNGIQSTTHFRQDHPFKSMAFKSETHLSDGTLIESSEHTWDVIHFDHGGYFPHIRQTQTKKYELDSSFVSSSTTTTQYDDYGNALNVEMTYNDAHTEQTTSTYTNDPDTWMLGRLIAAQVTKEAPGQDPLTRSSSFRYNLFNGALEEEKSEPGHATLEIIKTYQRDSFGNIISSITSGPNFDSTSQQTIYDDKGRFIIQSTNALGHSETSSYDSATGLVIRRTGLNGLTTRWSYDSFGRVIQETRPDTTKTRTLYHLADGNGPNNEVYHIRTDSFAVPYEIIYYDSLDREIRRETIGFDGRQILIDRHYNNLGEVIKVSDPYFADESAVWTETAYDVLGRPMTLTLPGNRVSTTQYEGWTTTTTNPLGQMNIQEVNSLGRLVKSTDALGKSIFYTYDSFGNLLQVEDSSGHTTSMTYDLSGNKLTMTDPDSGDSSYQYNALGELISQTNAKNQPVTFEYDRIGRLIRRVDPEGTSYWEYDTQPNGIGKPTRVVGADGYEESYTYDLLSRPTANRRFIDSQDYTTQQTYDVYSRPETLTYPSGFQVENIYDAKGYLIEVRDGTGALHWQINEVDAKGQLEKETLGNGLVTTRMFDPLTNYLNRIQTGTIQDLEFFYDDIGNLTRRTDVRNGLLEDFTYDSLNRLVNSSVFNGSAVGLTYDDHGNITSKSDVGQYVYGENGAGIHAVTSITGPRPNSYSYDANGNRITSQNGSVTYTSFNKPSTIISGTTNLQFSYGPHRSRYKQVIHDSNGTTTKIYIGGIFEKKTDSTTTEEIHYIQANGSTIAVFARKDVGTETTRYLHKDNLGSVQSITNASGNVVEELSYDAWGKRRQINGTSPTTPISSLLDRGFTGHEYLDGVELIHMNGRVYDPIVGRFLSPDPFVQTPDNTQNLNRYSYVLNNPLAFTDPSGFFIDKIFDSIKDFVKDNKVVLIAVAVSTFTAGWASGAIVNASGFATINAAVKAGATIVAAKAAIVGGVVGGFSGSFTGSLAGGGSFSDAFSSGLRGGAIGGLNGGIFHQVGINFSGAESVVAHGVAGGGIELIEGGKFGHGFVASAFMETFSPSIGDIDPSSPGINGYRTLAAVVIGGTASRLGGGSFSNGAITNSFSQMYEDYSTDYRVSLSIELKLPHREQVAFHFSPGAIVGGAFITETYFLMQGVRIINLATSATTILNTINNNLPKLDIKKKSTFRNPDGTKKNPIDQYNQIAKEQRRNRSSIDSIKKSKQNRDNFLRKYQRGLDEL